MLQLTPQSICIIDCYDDGQDAKHFTFEPLGFVHNRPIQVGQFFMLSVPGAGQAAFTYAALPDSKGRFVALIRKVGKLTKALFKLKKGAVLGYNGPFGRGWPVAKLPHTEVLIVAGGCGLVPLAATIDYLIDAGQAETTTVIYGAGEARSQVLQEERSYWKPKLVMHEILLVGNQIKNLGTPSEHIARVLAEHDRQPQIVLTCGPQAMMESVAETCVSLAIDSDKIWLSLEKRMSCGVGLCGHCYLADKLVCRQGPTFRYDELLELENKTSQFQPHSGLLSYC
ncbi:MAG: anaerobic sulfite reductase subunit B [Paraglaciecola sp.]|jgi:anaerobic sulfite reductase subunit B